MPDTLTLAGRRPADFVGTQPRAVVELLGRSAAVTRVREVIRRTAPLDGGVLIVAEAGADVEPVAREVHQRGRAPGAPFVAVDCAHGMGRLEALLFGGSTPGSSGDALEPIERECGVAAARGGTLFLQDVGELPASVQSRLARVVRDGETLIDGQAVAMPFRLMASAAPGIDSDVYTRRFRPDLFRRLSSSRIDLPPLRDRPDDVPALATRLLEDVCQARHLPERAFTEAALALLSALSWPGNVAELRTVIDRVVAEGPGGLIQIEHLFPAVKLDRVASRFVPAGHLKEARLRFERDYIAAVLQHHDWRMTEAARTLGMQRPNLYRKARQLGITLTRVSE